MSQNSSSSPLHTKSHRRRTSNLVSPATEEKTLWSARTQRRSSGTASAVDGQAPGIVPPNPKQFLPTIPGTPNRMSLDRSPSPNPDGGWSSPGLSPGLSAPRSGKRTPSPRAHFDVNAREANWATAKARSENVKGFAPKNQSWIPRRLRNLSLASLPRFDIRGGQRDYSDKEKLNRGRHPSNNHERVQMLLAVLRRAAWRLRAQLMILLGVLLFITLFYKTPAHKVWRRTSFLGGGNKFVVILASNQGGGVMEWKGPREWAIERDSIRNKKKYTSKHGYDLEIVDMAVKKRYAHEWRESWEKVDTIRRCMREYPAAEW